MSTSGAGEGPQELLENPFARDRTGICAYQSKSRWSRSRSERTQERITFRAGSLAQCPGMVKSYEVARQSNGHETSVMMLLRR
ncbi:hypothetical protein PISMIDRAFT_688472 [Pisolithus microcarpus 441]|uniref:Uncharacterized protein n=1 Tax=Pisolithus microcarpus 441 TaxID=765257 RepID=A0A0C9XMS4_9AGAM|nr:hypothetical protein PISMIDRAFT_688472 [Pisolithus microcarpus 441]